MESVVQARSKKPECCGSVQTRTLPALGFCVALSRVTPACSASRLSRFQLRYAAANESQNNSKDSHQFVRGAQSAPLVGGSSLPNNGGRFASGSVGNLVFRQSSQSQPKPVVVGTVLCIESSTYVLNIGFSIFFCF